MVGGGRLPGYSNFFKRRSTSSFKSAVGVALNSAVLSAGAMLPQVGLIDTSLTSTCGTHPLVVRAQVYPPATTQRYPHLAADPLNQAADRISGEIAAAMNGNAKGQVAPIRR